MGTRQKRMKAERPGRANDDGRRRKAPRLAIKPAFLVVLRVEDVHSGTRFLLQKVVWADNRTQAVRLFRDELDRTRRDLICHETFNVVAYGENSNKMRHFRGLVAADGTPNPTDPTGPRAA